MALGGREALWNDRYPGMPSKTLRDELAMAALGGLIRSFPDNRLDGNALDAYRYADAMLEARNAQEEKTPEA